MGGSIIADVTGVKKSVKLYHYPHASSSLQIMEPTLQFGRDMHLAFLVPDEACIPVENHAPKILKNNQTFS